VFGNIVGVVSKYLAQVAIFGGMISGLSSGGSVNSIFTLANSL